MDIIGLWKITEANVMDMDFNQTWRKVEDILADDSIHPMQKAMAQNMYLFGEDGKMLQLMPEEYDKENKYEKYDENYVIGHKADWEEKEGRLFFAAEGNGQTEIVPDGDGFIIFDMYKIRKV